MKQIDRLLEMARPLEKNEFREFLHGIPTEALRELAEGLPLNSKPTITAERVIEIYTTYGGERFIPDMLVELKERGADGATY